MLRGEVRLVDLEPVRGAEADKRRPAVVVSNDGANATTSKLWRRVVTVVLVTSNIRRVYPFQVLLPARATGLRHDSKAQAEQIRSVALQRLGPRVASVPPEFFERLDEALRLHLAL
jgi:mRNA interferase MazF